MKRSALIGSVAACLCLGLASPLLAAEPAVTGAVNSTSPSSVTDRSKVPDEKCLSDLRVFDNQMEKDGYWLGGSGYGYGYPLGGYGYGYDYPIHARSAGTGTHYESVRPGYEVQTLLAAASILARHGQQQPCENVLASTQDIYKLYIDDMNRSGMPMADVQGWRNQQIAAAKPVASLNTLFRSDQLLGTAVRNPQYEALGSVEDIVMSPLTGKIAYLVISRGGIFGIGEKYVPVPWQNFKATPNTNLLVLDTTKATMNAAPQLNRDQFTANGQFDQESPKVDAYWKTHLSDKGND